MKQTLLISFLMIFIFACSSNSKEKGLYIEASDNGETALVKIDSDGLRIEAKDGEDQALVSIDKNGIRVKANEGRVGIDKSGISAASDHRSADHIQVDGMGGNHEYFCNGENVEITGAKNTVKLMGKVGTLEVTGMANVIFVETVNQIEGTGMNNKVFWSNGPNNQEPNINSTGINNSIERKKI